MDPRGKDLENVDKLWSISEKAYGISFESYDNAYQWRDGRQFLALLGIILDSGITFSPWNFSL